MGQVCTDIQTSFLPTKAIMNRVSNREKELSSLQIELLLMAPSKRMNLLEKLKYFILMALHTKESLNWDRNLDSVYSNQNWKVMKESINKIRDMGKEP